MFARTLSAFAAVALTAVAVVGSSSASAQDLDAKAEVVGFADLDLSTTNGQARLDRRLRSAATRVCDSGNRDVRSTRLDAECRAKALTGARTEVAALTSRHGGRTEVALRR